MIVLAVGDVVGGPGRRAVEQLLPGLVRRHSVDFVVVNGENSAGGAGITPETAQGLLNAGAHCITTGNHVWKHRAIYSYIDDEPRLLRPANYPQGTPGRGLGVYRMGEFCVAVLNLQGLAGLEPLDCPLRTADALLSEADQAADVVLVDFHAESTAEKAALAHYLDGRVSLIWGTHTHVQTADERLLAGGTGFITDIGMTGPEDSVIGVAKEKVIEKMLHRMPVRFDVPEGPVELRGLLAEIDPVSGRAVALHRIHEKL